VLEVGALLGATAAGHDLDLERVGDLDVAPGLLAYDDAEDARRRRCRILRLAPRAREVVGDVDEDERVKRQRERALVGHG